MPANRSHCFVTSLIHWINTLVFDACYRTRKSHASEGFEIAWTVVAEASKWLANEKNRRWRYKEKGKRMGSFGATRYIIIQGNSFAEIMGNAVITMNLASEHDWAKPRIHPTPLLFQHRPSCNCYSLIYKARSSGQDFTLNSVKKHLESGAMKKSKLVHEHASPLRSSATNKFVSTSRDSSSQDCGSRMHYSGITPPHASAVFLPSTSYESSIRKRRSVDKPSRSNSPIFIEYKQLRNNSSHNLYKILDNTETFPIFLAPSTYLSIKLRNQ
uniref:Uncharacterized protein n=1 Tax=Vespula pensylvanica TaxID=30213 RepID=A0A834P579_VESPE|nr:hypothetical protein H0235_005751 [Vespula pensylvanica]